MTAVTVTGSATVGGVTFSPIATVTLGATPAPPPPASSQCEFGVWDPSSVNWSTPDGNPVGTWNGAALFSAAPVKSVSYFSAWLSPFPVVLTQLAAQHGATVYLNLEPQNPWGGGANPAIPDISAGRYDAWLTAVGQGIKAGNNVCRVTWAHEMNGNGWYPWQQSGGVSPAQWVAGWTHVYQVIKAAAGNLAQMVWCPNNIDVGPIAPYWPGPAFCDVAAADMYLNTASASQTYSSFARQTVDAIGKLDGIGNLAGQVWNAETGVLGTNREARITQFVNDMRADGRVAGMTIFNEGTYALDASEIAALCAAVNAWDAS